MSSRYAERYGIPGPDVSNLNTRYRLQNLQEGFGTFDDFVKFCADSGFKSGMFMRKKDTEKIHSPENTYFVAKYIPVHDAKEKIKKQEDGNWICADCKNKPCPASGWGCPAYRKAWIENWDKHIHYKKPDPVVIKPKVKEFFRYEHPDLVREGIVFHGNP